jgi:hypothetical protein
MPMSLSDPNPNHLQLDTGSNHPLIGQNLWQRHKRK